jgi:hypothetical protein
MLSRMEDEMLVDGISKKIEETKTAPDINDLIQPWKTCSVRL